jgi:hypothetical protein
MVHGFLAAEHNIWRSACIAVLLILPALATHAMADPAGDKDCIASAFEILPHPPSISVYDETGRFPRENLVALQRFADEAAKGIWQYLRVNSTRDALIILSDQFRTPYSEGPDTFGRGKIYLPAERYLPDQPERSRLALHHELTHLMAPGKLHGARLLIEGLAVHVEDRIGHPNYPDGDETPDDTVRAIEKKLAFRIPLAQSEAVRLEGPTGEERRLAYAQEGSFVGWLIDTKGPAAFMQAYTCGDPLATEGWNLTDLERDWRSWLYKSRTM